MPDDLRALSLPEAVLFDLDGTLVDTVETRISAWLDGFAEGGIPAEPDQLAPLRGLAGRRLARLVAGAGGGPLDDDEAEAIDHRCGELYDARNTDPRPLPGVRAVVASIEARGIRWSIATSSRQAQVASSVRALGLDDEPTITDASHVERAKPDPELLLRAAEDLGVAPARCWYVGDSRWDMLAAVAAGMVAIGVTAGAAIDADGLRAAGARVVVETLDDVAAALRDG